MNLEPKARPTPNGTMETTVFLPAFLEDNELGVARDPDYEKRLMKRDPKVAKALRFGNWDVFAGQFFAEWVREQHVCNPFEIPRHWPKWRSVDWGYAAPWCVLFWARDPDTRRLYVFREIYKILITDPQQARLINETSLPGEDFAFTFADPSMWTRDTKHEVVTSTYDQYLSNGVFLTKADNDHANKYRKTHSVLALLPDGKTGVQVFSTCYNLIRTMPALMGDPDNPEELLDGQEDHAFDAFAYGLTKYVDPAPEKPQEKKKEPQKRNGLYRMKNL
jgi:hypothetical protein